MCCSSLLVLSLFPFCNIADRHMAISAVVPPSGRFREADVSSCHNSTFCDHLAGQEQSLSVPSLPMSSLLISGLQKWNLPVSCLPESSLLVSGLPNLRLPVSTSLPVSNVPVLSVSVQSTLQCPLCQCQSASVQSTSVSLCHRSLLLVFIRNLYQFRLYLPPWKAERLQQNKAD